MVGHQAPQQLGSLIARRDNDNKETVIPAKRPRKPPDTALDRPPTAVFSIPPRSHEGSPRHHMDGPKLHQNNEAYFSVNELVSKRRVTQTAPTPMDQTRYSPCFQDKTRLKTRIEPYYGPRLAVSSIHGRLPMEVHHRRLDGAVPDQSSCTCCSGMENVSERRTVPQAPSPYIQVNVSPAMLDPTRPSQDPTYSPQAAVLSFHQRFLPESCLLHLDSVEVGLDDVGRCSVKENVSNYPVYKEPASAEVQRTSARESR